MAQTNQNNNRRNAARAAAEARRRREEHEERYRLACAKRRPVALALTAGALVVSIVMVLLFAAKGFYIHNTDVAGGVEISVSGFQAMGALLSGAFESVDYGDIPYFYYWAGTETRLSAVFILISFLVAAAAAVVAAICFLFTLRNRDAGLIRVSVLCHALCILLFIAANIVISLLNGPIISGYCSGNPACSVRTDLIWNVLLALVALAASIAAAVGAARTERILHPAKDETGGAAA